MDEFEKLLDELEDGIRKDTLARPPLGWDDTYVALYMGALSVFFQLVRDIHSIAASQKIIAKATEDLL